MSFWEVVRMKRALITFLIFTALLLILRACDSGRSDHKIYHEHLISSRHGAEIDAIKRCGDTGGMVILTPVFYSMSDCKYPPTVSP